MLKVKRTSYKPFSFLEELLTNFDASVTRNIVKFNTL